MTQDSNAILALDQGTSSSRAVLFAADGTVLGISQREFEQIFPADGWVEHRPSDIWDSVVVVGREMVRQAEELGRKISAIAIANQRETTLVWDRFTGEVVCNAIVWQDRRTADQCRKLRDKGHQKSIQQTTGLLLDPYFSATKIAWILDHVEGARRRAENGDLCFGTVDSFLIWRMTQGRHHVTDATNASRTNLYNINNGKWDENLCQLFGVPMPMLPEIRDCASHFGDCAAEVFGQALPICGVAGDQQAAVVGQACFEAGDVKSTYGTGCFMLVNTGQNVLLSKSNLLSTIAYQIDGQRTYGIEGSIFVSGAIIQWLRDGMGLFSSASQTEELATKISSNEGVYMVPALTGLGAPHWAADARGAIYGITRDTGPEHFVRAALESVAYQSRDLIEEMRSDGIEPKALKVDGGMTANNWLMQFIADMLDLSIERPAFTETTALGAAVLAMLGSQQIRHLRDAENLWQPEKTFTPLMLREDRDRLLAGWRLSIKRTLVN